MEKMLKDIEAEIAESKATLDGQKRLITNMSGHAKNKSISHNSTRSSLDQIQQESERNERIAREMSRSQFMALGDNPPKMASESSHSIFKSNWQTFSEKNHSYI